MHKKAQTATEYLIILAVVIVVALIVVGVMGGIPGIGKGVGRKASASYWKSADVAIDAYSVTAAGLATLKVRNNLDVSVQISAFTVGGADLTGNSTTTLSPGQTTTLTSGATALPCTGSFAHAVSITYVDQVTSATYTTDGDGHTLEGTCAS